MKAFISAETTVSYVISAPNFIKLPKSSTVKKFNTEISITSCYNLFLFILYIPFPVQYHFDICYKNVQLLQSNNSIKAFISAKAISVCVISATNYIYHTSEIKYLKGVKYLSKHYRQTATTYVFPFAKIKSITYNSLYNTILTFVIRMSATIFHSEIVTNPPK